MVSVGTFLWRPQGEAASAPFRPATTEREFCIDNLLVRIHYIIVMIKWTGLAP